MIDDLGHLHNSFEYSETNSLPKIVVVEDDPILSKAIGKFLTKKLECDVVTFLSPNECLSYFEETDEKFCLITDISFDGQGLDGLLLIDVLKERGHTFSSIVMTGFASIENAINATKKGVFHYLTKPFDLQVLENLAVEAFSSTLKIEVKKKSLPSNEKEKSKRFSNARSLKLEMPEDQDIFSGMIGRSKIMKKVFERISKVAESSSTVFISGPSGTGKELVARAIHQISKRNCGPLVNVNCGAIPSELLESELFGHMKGSFTGAISDRKGRFELANNGSIFLDEIGDMPLLLQVKLLRVLQGREIERVGGDSPTPVDVRIITATHRDLELAVREGNFREDLFYRLNVIPVKMPSLKERKEDIPLLISYFLKRYSSADGSNCITFTEDVLELLLGYSWPGNVRELENLIERLVILKGGSRIKISDLPDKFLSGQFSDQNATKIIELPEDGINLKQMLYSIEESLITQALSKTSGNKNRASKLLQMNRTTLIEKLKKFELFENRCQ